MPLTVGFLIFAENDTPSRGDVTLFLILIIVAFLALYWLGDTRGRAIFLGLALLALWAVVLVQVGGDSNPVPFQDQISRGAGGVLTPTVTATSDSSTDVSVASLIIGVAMLGTACLLDRGHRQGAATPFVVVGAIATFTGAIALASDKDQLVGGLLLTGAGVLVGLTGSNGHRRASTWIGAIAVAVGLAIVIDDIDGNSEWGTIALAAACAAALLVVGQVLAVRLREPVDGEPPELAAVEAVAPPAATSWSAPAEPPAQPTAELPPLPPGAEPSPPIDEVPTSPPTDERPKPPEPPTVT